MAQQKERLDKLLVDRGLARSRSRAQALIMAGEVYVEGKRSDKAGTRVPVNAGIEVAKPLPYVSRGGHKLEKGLDAFHIDVQGRICADVGASTGGFTDLLLQRGAARVYAIDVGYGQLRWKLRQDERVVVMERTNARYLDSLPELVSFVSVDVSFISLRLILPAARKWLAEDADVVALVKPQFEAGREQVGKGGIVRDKGVHRQVLQDLWDWTTAKGLSPQGLARSPITGAEGNVEFLLWLRPAAEHVPDAAATLSAVLE